MRTCRPGRPRQRPRSSAQSRWGRRSRRLPVPCPNKCLQKFIKIFRHKIAFRSVINANGSTSSMKAVCIGPALCIFAAHIMSAQPAASPLTFEVASVRPSPADARGFIDFLPGGGLRALGIPLKTLITLAYDVRDFQVSGAPAGSIPTASILTREAKLLTRRIALPPISQK